MFGVFWTEGWAEGLAATAITELIRKQDGKNIEYVFLVNLMSSWIIYRYFLILNN